MTVGITGSFGVVGAAAPLGYFGKLDAARLSHGYLFTGPAGVGKKTFARELARSLLCETPKPTLLGYCNTCTGCKLVNAGTHPDLLESDGVVKIGSDGGRAPGDDRITARDLVREFSLHGYRSRYHIVIFGDVEFATHEAANALLKFFEEPPAGVVVILTTSAPGTLIPTIRSRMLRIAFPLLKESEVREILVRTGTAEEAARRAAAVSLGSVTRARAALAGETSGSRAAAVAWFEAALRGKQPDPDFLRLDDRSVTAAEKREAVASMLEMIRLVARDWAVLAVAPDGGNLYAEDLRAQIERFPKRTTGEILALQQTLADAERLARTNVSAVLVADLVRMQLAPGSAAAAGVTTS
jgi:DNA polymerase-3 subunit delta'